MSYYNQQQGGYPPPQGYPPNSAPGYGAPPPQSPYPTQQQGYNQQYPPPGQNYSQYPPAQYPPPGQYGQPPPPQQYGQPAYGGPPPQQNYGGYGAPPPQQYNAPPPNQYGHAPPPQPYGQQPQYGAPPPFAAAQQGFPSPGYGPQSTAPINVDNEVVNLKKAFKGWGTDEKLLIQCIAKQDPIQINTIREQFNVRFQSDLLGRVDGEVKGDFKNACLEICRGPLMADCYTLRDATRGLGTKEAALNDVLMGRSNADINAIKSEFQKQFGESLESVLRGDLSGGTQQLFIMVIAARRNEETAPVIPQQTEADVAEVQRAMGTILKDATQVCQVLTSKSDAQLRAISQTYQQRYHKSLDKALEEKFSGHMEKALRLLVARANNRAASDAEQLEETMKGIGTRDTLLIQRLVRAHWDHRHLAQVRAEFLKIRREGLVKRLEGETSGDYRKLLIAMAQ